MEQKVQTLIDAASASTCSNDLLMVAIAAKNISTNVSSFIDTIANIPDLYTTPMVDGTIIFVAQLNTYLISNGYTWYSLDGRTYRYDGPSNLVYAWGDNDTGNLGDNSTTLRSSPVSVVGGFTDWCQASAGNFHSIAVRTNGTLWAWGNGSWGRMGDSSTDNKLSPVSVVGGFTDWCQVSAGNYHSAAVRTNGTLWAWGFNGFGGLGDNTTVNKSSPVSVVGGFTDWCQASAGNYHSAAVRTNGTLWAWGNNGRGQLGDNTIVHKSSPVSVVGGFTDWCQASVGRYHSVAVRTNGTIWAWGNNACGELGDNTIVNKSSPISVVGGFTDWCQVSAGRCHSAAIRTNGTIWAWGRNYGVLGDNTIVHRSSPVSVVGGFADWRHVSTNAVGTHTLAIRTIP